MKTLVVKCNVDEYADQEFYSLVKVLSAEFIINPSTSELLDTLSNSAFDIVWFIAHMSGSGIKLNGGVVDIWSMSSLFLHTKLLVLNGCKSADMLSGIKTKLPTTAVVATTSEIDSQKAYIFGRLFAANLVKYGNNIKIALSELANKDYILIGNNSIMNNNFEELIKAIYDLKNEINIINLRLKQLETFQPVEGIKPIYLFVNMFLAVLLSVVVSYIIWGLIK